VGCTRDVQYAFIKLLKIWFDFHHVRVVAHEMTMEGRERLDLRRGEVKGKKKENMWFSYPTYIRRLTDEYRQAHIGRHVPSIFITDKYMIRIFV
jgi:hypothetical protein